MLKFVNAMQIVLLFACSPLLIRWLINDPEPFRFSYVVGSLCGIGYIIFFGIMTSLVYENLDEK